MSYTILKSDLSQLTAISDGTIDQTTDLTLIGKNTSNYGLLFNENFVYLLENFANISAPNRPITGQLWFDLNENRLKVYDSAGTWKVSGGTVVSSNIPTLTTGDLWIDSSRQQLYFNDGTATLLAGPIYSSAQGVSGFVVEDVIDTNNISHTILSLYVGQVLLGVYNADAAFTPATSIAGVSGIVSKGFTATNLPNLVFDQLVTRSNTLVANDGTLRTAENFLSSTSDSLTVGSITISNSVPLKLGASGNIVVTVDPATGFTITSTLPNQNFNIKLKDSSNDTINALNILANSHYTGIYNKNPQATLHIGKEGGADGSLIIEGNLTVKGTTTSTSTVNINLADYTLTLAATQSPSDSTANGAGLIIAGTTNKSIKYSNTVDTVDGGAFQSSENFDLFNGKYFSINGQKVLTASSLGPSITTSFLTQVGNLNNLQAAYLNISTNRITYVNPGQTTGDIVLAPLNGTVSVNNSRISNISDPINAQDGVNLNYFANGIKAIPLAISLPTTGLSEAQIASTFLQKIYLTTDHGEGCICYVIRIESAAILKYKLTNGTWVYQSLV